LDPSVSASPNSTIRMPRQVRDSSLESRAARGRLKVRHKPYFRLIEPGLHLGYRKLASGPGTWIARRYTGGGKYRVENLRAADASDALIVADDYTDADGVNVLSFAQAQTAARSARHRPRKGPYTVADAIADYLDAKHSDGRDISDSRSRANAHILPALGDTEAAALTAEHLRKWHRALANAAPRRRTRAGEPQQYGDKGEGKRRRWASANRVLTILKAALNHAFHDGKIAVDTEWRRAKPFRGVAAARLRYLSLAEARRLINAAEPPNFRLMVQAALQTGARYGQLAALTVADFNADVGTLRMRSFKGQGGHERGHHVTLTDEGQAFFLAACAGRAGRELIFRNGDREWRKSEQKLRVLAACEHAKIVPPVSFHTLRHTWASLAVMAGVPLLVIAKNLGHADTRMVEGHYGHMAPSYVAEAIRAGAPRFGPAVASNVKALR
jgi:integrase